jgi:hypothetical protein
MSLRGRLGLMYKNHLEKRARSCIENHPVLASLTATMTPSTGAQYSDYWALYSYVRKYKPKEILELGPGITTLVLAQAVKENGEGRITAMEDVPFYFDATQKIIPPELASFIDLRLSPKTKYQYGPFTGVAYTEIPQRQYEFVYVDGPNYEAEKEFDADIIQVIRNAEHPVTAYIDSRTGSCFIYHLLFGSKFRFHYTKRLGIIDRATKRDLRTFNQVVATSMKRREFHRW